jgi:hypothetical protein
MPGYNVFGDGLFFGEAMLKEKMVEVSPRSAPLCPLSPFSPFSPFSPSPPCLPSSPFPLSQEKGGRGGSAEETWVRLEA